MAGRSSLLGPEQADALGAGDLNVKAVGATSATASNPSGSPRRPPCADDGVATVLLHVAEEDVVGVLQLEVERAQAQ